MRALLDIFLGRDDLARMGVIPHNFPSVWSNSVRRVEAVDEVDQIVNIDVAGHRCLNREQQNGSNEGEGGETEK